MEEKTAKTTRKKKPVPRKTTPADVIGDLIKQQKKRIEKQKKWKAHLKETMSPKHYQEYLEREKKRKNGIGDHCGRGGSTVSAFDQYRSARNRKAVCRTSGICSGYSCGD